MLEFVFIGIHGSQSERVYRASCLSSVISPLLFRGITPSR
jgi:hypothetical protein